MKRFFIILTTLVFICSILLLFLNKSDYKIVKFGNNIISKSMDRIVQDILNMQSYEAICEITIKSNKNENKYTIKQKWENGFAMQEVLLPENMQGLISTYDGTNLTIKNTNLNLQKIYENYQELTKEHLSLNSFIQDYEKVEQKSSKETEEEIILEVALESKNKYVTQKRLYIDKKTGLPIRLEVQDVTQKVLVYILYNEITMK